MICQVCQANIAQEGATYCTSCGEKMAQEAYELLMGMSPAQLQTLADDIRYIT